MPTFVRSAMNPYGTWQSDAMDQTEQWNASRGDQWQKIAMDRAQAQSQDDWRKDIALRQLGLQETMWKGGREDSAAARLAEAERWNKQFDYLSGRDTAALEREAAREAAANARWQQGFDLQKQGIEQERQFRDMDIEDRKAARAASKPLTDLQSQLALMQLDRERQRQAAMANASGYAAYSPSSEAGREAQQYTMATTGDPMQASMAAKQAERQAAAADAKAQEGRVRAQLQDLYAKDKSVIGFDPTERDVAAGVKEIEALKILYKQAGMTDAQIQAAVADLMRSTLTTGGRTDINAGFAEQLLDQMGISYR